MIRRRRHPHRRTPPTPTGPALVALLLLAGPLLLAATGQNEEGPPPPPPPDRTAQTAKEKPPGRVVIRVNRYTELMGHVELEDQEVIVIRTLAGDLESFAKDRVLRIIHLVDPAPNQRGIIFLRNGQERDGIIISDDFDAVVVEIEGIRTTLKREVVDQVQLEPTFDEMLAHFKTTLRPELGERHLELCDWLVKEKRYEIAETELRDLLSRHNIAEARQLLKIVEAQLTLQSSSAPRRKPVEPEIETPIAIVDARLVTEADVNLIRVFEIDFGRPPKIEIGPDTIRELIERYGTNPMLPADAIGRRALFKAEPLSLVELMFRLKARDLYPKINVLTEPAALTMFRDRVHNAWLLNNCGTSRCHGGTDAGKLYLHRRNAKSERVRYSNLLTLERLEIDPKWPLVNYDRPLDSLIIQYGLPRPRARMPHPPARGWQPAFRRQDDRMVRSTVEWMDSMLKPRVRYPVEYEPPVPAVPETPASERRSR